MFYRIKHAVETALIGKEMDVEKFVIVFLESYRTNRGTQFLCELLEPIFDWAYGFAQISENDEIYKERLVAEIYVVLSKVL